MDKQLTVDIMSNLNKMFCSNIQMSPENNPFFIGVLFRWWLIKNNLLWQKNSFESLIEFHHW